MEGESKENIELVEEHLKIAGQIVGEELRKHDPDEEISKEFSEAALAIEKAEAEVEDLEDA